MRKTWFITGASSGFGRQLTEQLLARGDCVAATSRRLEPLADLVERYGKQLWTAKLDVTDTTAIHRVIDRAFSELKRIDVLVSNAGYGLCGAAEELTDEMIDHQIATNLLGSIQLIRAALPHLRAQGGGRIVQMSSMGGQIAFPGLSLYHATKWGIEGFCEALIPEVASFGIEVTLVEPGSARTGFFGGASRVLPPAIPAYTDTPIGGFRSRLEGGVLEDSGPGDPTKMAQAIIASVEVSPAPKRLTLGSDAYELVTAALTERLSVLKESKELAYSTDADDK